MYCTRLLNLVGIHHYSLDKEYYFEGIITRDGEFITSCHRIGEAIPDHERRQNTWTHKKDGIVRPGHPNPCEVNIDRNERLIKEWTNIPRKTIIYQLQTPNGTSAYEMFEYRTNCLTFDTGQAIKAAIVLVGVIGAVAAAIFANR